VCELKSPVKNKKAAHVGAILSENTRAAGIPPSTNGGK